VGATAIGRHDDVTEKHFLHIQHKMRRNKDEFEVFN
jgi:hypothetical protein